MPATYNLPRVNGLWNEQDVELYNKLPYYLAALQGKYYPMWNTWNKLVGTMPWQKNMGPILKGVRAEPSPIGRQMFFPNDITSAPKKDVVEVREMTEQARVKRHLFESPYFHFIPSFQDFRKDQVGFAMKDLGQQIMAANDFFIRSVIFHRSPYVFVSGKAQDSDGAEFISAPVGDGSDDGSTGKTTGWLTATVAKVGTTKGNLSLKVMNKVGNIMREEIQAPAFDGMANTVKDNETIKGNYVIVGSGEAYGQLTFDEHALTYKSDTMNLLNDEFAGKLFGFLVYKTERFPLRIAADGTFPAPQLWETNTGAYNYGETVPNPAYTGAPFEVAFCLGAEPYKSLSVGSPPKEFASGSMSESKFNSLFWNGEVRLTDNLIVNYGSNNLDTNKYGEYLQLISSVVHGIIPVNRRFVVPIIYRRWRVETN